MIIDAVLRNRVAVRVGLHEPLPRGDRVLFPTGQRVAQFAHHDLGDAVGSCFTGNRIRIIVNDKNRVATVFAHAVSRAVAVLVVITIQNRIAQRLTDQLRMLLVVSFGIPAECCVRSRNHIAVAELLGGKRLLGYRLRAVASGLGDHALIARKDVRIRIVHVDLYGVDDLTPRACRIVDNNLGLLNTGSQLPKLLGNQLVVGGCSRLIILGRCKGAHRKQTCNHHYRKKHRQKSGGSSFHIFLLKKDFQNVLRG